MFEGFASIVKKQIPALISLPLLLLNQVLPTTTVSGPWTQTDWSGGAGQAYWNDYTKFSSANGVTATTTSVQLAQNWYSDSWNYRKLITIDHTQVGGDLTDHPILIFLPIDPDLSSHAQPSGDDILFTTSDGKTKLDHQIEKYNSTGALIAWVKIPFLSSSVDTNLYLYYGNSESQNQQNVPGTWSNGYAAVYHLTETSLTHQDSTSNMNHSSAVSLEAQGTAVGMVDGADSFNSTSHIVSIPNSLTLNPSTDMSIEAWIKPSTLSSAAGHDQTIARSVHSTTPFQSYIFYNRATDNHMCFQWKNTSGTPFQGCSNYEVPAGEFTYITAVHAGNSFKLYTNGIDSTGQANTTTGTLFVPNGPLNLGTNASGRTNNFSGIIDEIRVSNVARTSGYFTTTYNNLQNPSNFIRLAPQINRTSQSLSGTLTSSIFDTSAPSSFGSLTYNSSTPTGSTAVVSVRTGNSPNLYDAPDFSSCERLVSGASLSTSNCVKDTHRYVQYQINLTTSDSSSLPSVSTVSLNFSPAPIPSGTGFVQRLGNKLYLDGQEFKFVGPNIYWAGLTDAPTTASPLTILSGQTKETQTRTKIDYPPYFQIDDALLTAKEMGANSIRSFGALSVGCPLCIQPELGVFNSEAYDRLDYTIKKAQELNLKIILPLSNEWYYYDGGKHIYTDWRGDPNEEHFYTNPLVIEDYKKHISNVLNHVNPYSGLAYKNDPTILAWEIGNELHTALPEWSQNIASFIKNIDQNHLVADGRHASSGSNIPLLPDQLESPDVDMYSTHFYPTLVNFLQTDAKLTNDHNKVYYVGEYDWTEVDNGDSLTDFIKALESNPISGDLFFTLFPHNETYGFVSHGARPLHYPGDTPDFQAKTNQLRDHAIRVRSISPSLSHPTPPYLHLPVLTTNGLNILWRGSVPSSTYNLQRSTGNAWVTVAKGLTDANAPFNDPTADLKNGRNYCYRIQGVNKDGVAGDYSNIQSIGNQIQNGSFEYPDSHNPLSFWGLNLNEQTAAIATTDNTATEGSSSIRVNTTLTTGTDYHVILKQDNINLDSSHSYTLSFSAKASTQRPISLSLQQAAPPYAVYFQQLPINLNTSWENFSYTFAPTSTNSNSTLHFNLGKTTGSIWFDNITLTDNSISLSKDSCIPQRNSTFSPSILGASTLESVQTTISNWLPKISSGLQHLFQ